MENYDELLSLVGSQYKRSAMYKAAGAFSELAGHQIDYSTLMTDAYQTDVQADAVELQAEMRANALRQQFAQSVGTYMFGAAQRGVDVRSGSVQQNIQRSSESIGKDVQTARENARMTASTLRTNARMQRASAKGRRFGSYMGLIKGLSSAVGSYVTGSELINKMSTPKKFPPVPPPKPIQFR